MRIWPALIATLLLAGCVRVVPDSRPPVGAPQPVPAPSPTPVPVPTPAPTPVPPPVSAGPSVASLRLSGEDARGALASFVESQKSGVSAFIAEQVKGWDLGQLTKLIEINVGRDLQFIRFNGMLIGGLAGLLQGLSGTPEGRGLIDSAIRMFGNDASTNSRSDPDVVAAKATLDAAKEKYKGLTGPYKADMKAEDALLNANHEELMRRGIVGSGDEGRVRP